MQPHYPQTTSAALHRTRGFGAIELIMTMVILGMVFLFALQGRKLLPPMRSFVTIQQINQYKSAVSHYTADFKAPPGDDTAASGRFRRPPALFVLGFASPVSYAGNGKIDGLLDDGQNPSGEQFLAWVDLRYGGYVEGDAALVGQSARPENIYGGTYGFAEDNFGLNQVLCLSQVPGADAELIDKKLDDRSIATGIVRATSQWDPTGAKNHFAQPDTAPYDPEKTYIICLPYES